LVLVEQLVQLTKVTHLVQAVQTPFLAQLPLLAVAEEVPRHHHRQAQQSVVLVVAVVAVTRL
jgi:hypothetical protein